MRALALLALLCVILAPIPVGAFRPQWWLMVSAILFSITAITIAAAAWSGRAINHPWSRLPLISWAYFLFICLTALHVLVVGGSASDLDAVYGLMRHIGFAAAAWLFMLAARRHSTARQFANVLMFAFAAYAIYGLATIAAPQWLPYQKDSYFGVATGPFVNRNSFATFMAMGATLGLAMTLADPRALPRKHRRGRRGSWLEALVQSSVTASASLLCLAAVLATGSRMGLFSALLGLSVVAAVTARRDLARGSRRRALVLGGGLAAACLISAVALLYGGTVAERLLGAADDASVRGALYLNVLSMIAERPLLGFGLDNFSEAFRAHHQLPVSPDRHWGLAHNTYLSLWVELGIILGSLPIIILALVGVQLWRRAQVASETPTTYLATAALGCLTLNAAHALLDFSLEMPANAYVFIVVIALALSPPNDTEQEVS